MQIHEIARAKKQLKEQPTASVWTNNRAPAGTPAATSPGAAAAAAQPAAAQPSKLASLGNAVGSYLNKRAVDYASSKTGVNLSPFGKTQNPYDAPAAYDKAMSAVNGVYKQQAGVQKKLFDQAVAQAMGSQGVTKANQLSGSTQDALAQNLSQQLHKNLMQSLTNDYTKLPELLDQDPATQAQAKQLVDIMTNSLTQIKNLGADDARQQAAWEALTKAAGEAMVMGQFKTKSGQQPGRPAAMDASVEKMAQTAAAGRMTAQQLGIPQRTIDQLQSRFPPGTDPKVDALFTALGIYGRTT